MLPTYTPHRYRGRGNGVYLVLIVVLSVALVAQFVYWKRQVSDLVLEVGGVHMRMEKQESTARRVMEEKAALGKLNELLQDGLNTCEVSERALEDRVGARLVLCPLPSVSLLARERFFNRRR
ncbi:unnamed protein product [Ostreobium quekettii]|uniref:Uncharacterized protein n=1 Tax=Ostreobium quekettii TaxID=121088 RepID=A0A8S1IZH7_9CHLO|nr:unnamed protein product [Ostreobium quekettii]